MEELVIKVTELNPQLEMEIRDLLADMGKGYARFEECELFVRMNHTGHVMGVACAVAGEEYCHLIFVAVRPEARGQGTGSMIINHVLSHYAGECGMMYLLTGDTGFFERFGFQEVAYERLPEEIRRRADSGAEEPGAAAMKIELPGNRARK